MTIATSPRTHLAAQHGFTAIELLVTITVLSVLMALAAPSFASLMERFRVNAGLDDLSAAIQLARSEAVRTRSNAIVLPRTDCEAGGGGNNWSCGVLVFADLNGDGAQNANEPTLKQTDGHNKLSVRHAGPVPGRITVNAMGSPSGGSSLVAYPSDKGDGADTTTTLCLSFGGRQRRVSGKSCS